MKACPECGSYKVFTYNVDNDCCEDCSRLFPAVQDIEEIYCHECSKAGGAGMAIYHGLPACKVVETNPALETDQKLPSRS